MQEKQGRNVEDHDENDELSLEALRYFIAAHCDPRILIELYYWSRERILVEHMREFVTLPEETKSSLIAFMKASKSNITTVKSKNGDLILSSPYTSQVDSAERPQPQVKH